jgi:hypothetical protein
MLKMEVEWKISFREPFTYIILDLEQRQVHHWKEHEILVGREGSRTRMECIDADPSST